MISAPRPPVIAATRGKSALTRIIRRTAVGVKATINDTFTNLNNFVILADAPTITSGKLTGHGAIRHRDEMATDSFMVIAVIGTKNAGKTRLIACASDSFDRFYGIEIDSTANQISIIKGTSVVATTSTGIFGILIGLLGFFLGSFGSVAVIPKFATVNVTVNANDDVAIWYDEPNSVIRAYKNDSQVTHLDVSPWEIPHGPGYRHWGVMQGVDSTLGVQFASIACGDV